MAEHSGKESSKSSVFSRGALFTKKMSSRATERVLQRIGKSAATKDETYREFVSNFTKQQNMATKLQKELKKYTEALKNMESSSRAIGECFRELYEPEWAGRSDVCEALDSLKLIWGELLGKVQDQLLAPIGTYLSHFPEIKAKVSKHERKVVDYDRQRRHLEQAKKAKGKGSEAKLSQAETDFEDARRIYDDLTNELYEEIPTFYDSRIPFYASIFQSLYVAEASYHSDTANVKTKLNDLMDVAAQDAASRVHSTRKARQQPPSSGTEPDTEKQSAGGDGEPDSEEVGEDQPEEPCESDGRVEPSEEMEENGEEQRKEEKENGTDENTAETSEASASGSVVEELQNEADASVSLRSQSQSPSGRRGPPKPVRRSIGSLVDVADDDTAKEGAGRAPVESPESLPSDNAPSVSNDFLYQVISTHPYSGQDEDELSFEKDELIHVFSFSDDEDQDDGWLKGKSTTSGLTGLFPANFTKKL